MLIPYLPLCGDITYRLGSLNSFAFPWHAIIGGQVMHMRTATIMLPRSEISAIRPHLVILVCLPTRSLRP